MMNIYIGEQVKNLRGEIGVITTFNNQYIMVDYPDRTASVVLDAFEKGYIKYIDSKLQAEVKDSIAKIEALKRQKTEEERIAAEKARAEKVEEERRTLPCRRNGSLLFWKRGTDCLGLKL